VAKGDYSPTTYEGIYTDEIFGLIGAFNRMAKELEVNQEDLLQARKIAALGTFTAGIAHELNNPINNIYLSAETYVEEYSDQMDADGKELMRDIMVQAERAGDIVKNLLDFSRTERPAFTGLDVQEIIRSTVALVKNQVMLAGIRLEVELPEGLPRVRGNLRNLQQVFMNLLLNSIQAMPEGGEITIGVGAEPPDLVRFDIVDTGTGIKPETLPHIFEPFFTTKGVGRGTGLGLAVTYSIVKRHGGRIEVKSRMEEGSVFSVFLPVARMEEQ
jgi:signal transduction histidine kinase